MLPYSTLTRLSVIIHREKQLADLTGRTYGDLLVIHKTDKRSSHGDVIYKCKCACGNTKEYKARVLPKRVSCGECTKEERTNSHMEERRKAKLRSGRSRFTSLSEVDQMHLINKYCFGKTVRQLSDDYGIDVMTCRDGIASFRERLNTMYELNYMAAVEKTKLPQEIIDKALKTTLIEDALADLLSSDDSETLTSSEMMYCILFVNTGSNETAIKESGFNKALPSSSPIKRQLLGMYLRNKPNIKAMIQLMHQENIEAIMADKRRVQLDLVQQVEQLKEAVAIGGASTDRGHLLRAIELLGKTVGAFEERVRVTEVNAADALDELLDMAKKEAADIKLLPDGTEADEHWEVSDE